MKDSALIGYSGFVGSNLKEQLAFDALYRSSNILDIRGQQFTTLVICAVPAVKWLANQNPDADKKNIDVLLGHIQHVRAKNVVLISTIDVYPFPLDVTESDIPDVNTHHAYGANRYYLEEEVMRSFETVQVVRLPGLFGTGLKKNVIFDFIHNNRLEFIDSRNVFQFYNLDYIGRDISRIEATKLPLVNISTAPVTVAEVAEVCLGRPWKQSLEQPLIKYDYKSNYAELFGGHNGYWYSKQQVLEDLHQYVQRTLQA